VPSAARSCPTPASSAVRPHSRQTFANAYRVIVVTSFTLTASRGGSNAGKSAHLVGAPRRVVFALRVPLSLPWSSLRDRETQRDTEFKRDRESSRDRDKRESSRDDIKEVGELKSL
jgi:hypothetical protein